MIEKAIRKLWDQILNSVTRLCVWILRNPLQIDDTGQASREAGEEAGGTGEDGENGENAREHARRRVPRVILHFAERYLQWESEQEREEARQEQEERENAFEPWIENPFQILAEQWQAEKIEREQERRDREREYEDLRDRVRELVTAYREKQEKERKQAEEREQGRKNRRKSKNRRKGWEKIVAENRETYLWRDRKHILWFPWSFTRYQLSRDRLFCETGFLRREEETVLLYRVQDLHLTVNLSQRIFGVGSIRVFSTDITAPRLDITHIRDPKAVRDLIHRLSEDAKRRRQAQVMSIRGLDYHQSLSDLDPPEDAPEETEDAL